MANTQRFISTVNELPEAAKQHARDLAKDGYMFKRYDLDRGQEFMYFERNGRIYRAESFRGVWTTWTLDIVPSVGH